MILTKEPEREYVCRIDKITVLYIFRVENMLLIPSDNLTIILRIMIAFAMRHETLLGGEKAITTFEYTDKYCRPELNKYQKN